MRILAQRPLDPVQIAVSQVFFNAQEHILHCQLIPVDIRIYKVLFNTHRVQFISSLIIFSLLVEVIVI